MEKELLEETTTNNEELELSEITTNDPYKNVCVSCEG